MVHGAQRPPRPLLLPWHCQRVIDGSVIDRIALALVGRRLFRTSGCRIYINSYISVLIIYLLLLFTYNL